MVTMPDMTGWSEVASADGAALGWMAAPDPDEPDVDYFEADRVPKAGRRAAALYEVAGLAADEAFAADEVLDMGRRAGLTGDQMDAAANVAWHLHQVEQLRK